MTSASASSPARPVELGLLPAARLVRVAVVFTAGLLLLTAAWLLVRRLGGALHEPLSGSALLLLGALLGSTLAAAGLIERRIVPGPGFGWILGLPVSRSLLTGAALMLGIAVSLPSSPAATLIVFWAFVLAGTVSAWSLIRLVPWRARGTTRSEEVRIAGIEVQGPSGRTVPGSDSEHRFPAFAESDEESEAEETLLPDDVSQRVVRARDERGAEIVYGTVRCDFVAGQRQQSVHIAFCPPLRAIASLTTDQVAGPPVQIKPVLVETYGAGLEVKLASPSKGPTQVQIQFFAFERPADDLAE